MFKEHLSKGKASRAQIYETAIRLFRERGFEETTMRDIGAELGGAASAAYYYFKGKDAIVLEYYDEIQRKHEVLVNEMMAHEKDPAKRIAQIHHLKLDILKSDRRIMGALLRYAGEPESELSFFSAKTRGLRQAAMKLFAEAIADADLPPDMAQVLPTMLWASHMGILLYFLYDKSAEQKNTRMLVDRGTQLLMGFIKVAKNPLLRPIRRKTLEFVQEAGLAPSA
ncbi:transcriptional regulator, TetR family [Candidatus Koribacter versatilis Ellin345]|uniref:Transcriptional regulator, TetR family n=2 Tax=Candidatus Korobacter versatilis TaxID=658062 RepID=Q1IVC7_KORVE|nr:transcriptional regulator, TetR family [Candidatus Koribacter versatilis Ellin345]